MRACIKPEESRGVSNYTNNRRFFANLKQCFTKLSWSLFAPQLCVQLHHSQHRLQQRMLPHRLRQRMPQLHSQQQMPQLRLQQPLVVEETTNFELIFKLFVVRISLF
jgi:hypothetical protein